MSINIALKGHFSDDILVQPTVEDVKLVENLRVRKLRHRGSRGFKNVIVPKPWGMEYLCGRNKHLEVWELYINSKAATSLHCHPEKDTLNIILEGTVTLETVRGNETLGAGDFRVIKAGAIHRTTNHSESRVRVLEIESPPNKYDLIRVQDSYGRESIGYVVSTEQEFSQKNENDFKLSHCLDSNLRSFPKKFSMRDFIPITQSENAGKKLIWMKELVFNGITLQSKKTELRKCLLEQSVKNLIVATGSVVLVDKSGCRKLLPGECVHDTPLSEFNWSSTKAKMLVW